jgi:chromosome segregation ATPase
MHHVLCSCNDCLAGLNDAPLPSKRREPVTEFDKLKEQFNVAMEYGDFYEASEIRDKIKAMEVKQMHAKALEKASEALPDLLKKLRQYMDENTKLKERIKQLESLQGITKSAQELSDKNPNFFEVVGQPG